jgi:hypothetical protein
MARQFLIKFSSTKSYKNELWGSQVVHAYRQIDWNKLIGASETCEHA